MDILVDVVNQRLQTATNLTSFIAGTQEFIRFVFNLDDDWDNLLTFAQFTQDGESYNQYLDNDNGAYLPSEIGVGTCTLSLYGSADNKRATTNFLTLKIEENNFVEDGNSTSITLSLYEQLANEVHTLSTWRSQFAADYSSADANLQQQINTKASQADLNAEISRARAAEQANAAAILLKANQSQVDTIASQVDQLANNETVANAINEAVSTEIANYITNGTIANLAIEDGSITRAKVDSDFEDTLDKADNSVQIGEQYPTLTTGDSIYLAAKAASDTVDGRVDNVVSEIQGAYTVDETHIYSNLGNAVRGALSQARLYTQTYIQGALIDYKAFTITMVDELPQIGQAMTFYLVPNNSGTGYDKYWWITDEESGLSSWDVFGSSSTLVVSSLPQTGDSDVDYILKTSSGCLFYKWIDGMWEIVAGSIAVVSSSLPQVGNEYTDYYILNESGVYVHYRFINGQFHSIGTETYTSDELDTLLAGISDRIDGVAADVQTNQTNISSLSRTVDRVASELDNLDVEGYTYSAAISQNDQSAYVFTLTETKDNVDTIKSQFVLPSGGGGGGAVSTTTLTVEKITQSPLIITTTDSAIIEIDYSSLDGDGETVDGTYSWKSGNTVIMSGALTQGRNIFDLSEFCSVGTQKFTLIITDEGGSTNVKTWTIQKVDVRIESAFNDRYTTAIGRNVAFTYTPYGAVNKTIHFKIDGVETTETTSASGTLQSHTITAQEHGSHLLEVWATATINSVPIETSHIYKDIIWYNPDKDDNGDYQEAVIGCIYRYDYYGNVTARQYDTTSIIYNVYDPTTNYPTVRRYVDNVLVGTETLSTAQNTWNFKSDDIGLHTLRIVCRNTTVTIKVNVTELGIDVNPITGGLEVDFNPTGITNSSNNRLWSNENYAMTVSQNFDWANGGYRTDENGDTYFLIKAGTRAILNYKMFSGGIDGNPSVVGGEIKIVFMTENVQDANATWFTNVETTTAEVDGNVVTTNMGIQMNVHEGWLKTNNASDSDVESGEGEGAETIAATNTYLYMPYSEEDIIEMDINIDVLDREDETAKAFVMAYEDGVPSKAYVYDSGDRFYQYTPQDMVIGSDYCDVRIYRLKIYSTSLTTNGIMRNFIADSRNSDTMLARYDRNAIYYNRETNKYTPYSGEGTLDPEKLAPIIPNVKILLLDTDHFTTSKKTFVKSSLRCIHASGGTIYEGDPYYDNWFFEKGFHSGQGTTSDNYGNAGRNVDFLFNCDGVHKPSDKVAAEAGYISQVTLGYNTENAVTETVTDWKGNAGKIALTRTSVPNNFFNLKVNIASSENVNNALLQKRYNDYLPYISPAKSRDSKVKNDMEFVPAILFIRENNPDISTHNEFLDTEWHFYALGNIGDSKKTDYTRAYDPTDMNEFTIEISDNTKNNATFQTGVYLDEHGDRQVERFTITESEDDGEIIYTPVSIDRPSSFVYPITEAEWNNENNMRHWAIYNEAFDGDHSFEPRYACCGDYRDGKLVNDTSGRGKAQVKINNNVWRAFYRWVITSTDQEFVDELDQWVVRSAAEFFYAYTHMYTMMDNRAKNTFWHFAKTGVYREVSKPVPELLHVYCELINDEYVTTEDTEIDSNKTYYTQYAFDFWMYDGDTGLGINNNGELVFPYGKEDTDYNIEGNPSSGYVFNGATSVFWCRLRDLLPDEIKTMFNTTVAADCFSATSLINQFDTFQECFPEEIWRLDIQRKYIRTFTGESIDNSKPKHDVQYLRDMMQGRKKYQRRQWMRDQEIYFGTKNLMNTVVGDNNRITFRCFTPTGDDIVVQPDYTLHIKPYSDMYLSVMFGNGGTTQVRAKGGTEYTIECPLSTMDDTQVTIYGANRIQELSDLSACYIAANNFSMATKLRKLVLGSTTEGYNNSRLVSLTLGNNKLLEELDIRNCGSLTGAINLSQCNNLLKLYAEGTRITGVTFATNGKVRIAHLPSTVNTLIMRNLNDMTDFSANLNALETLTLQGGTLNSKNLVSNSLNTLRVLYLYDIDWTLPDTTMMNTIANMFYSLLTGSVYVSGEIRNQELLTYANKWSDLEVTYDSNNLVTQYLATYVNADGTTLYETYVDRGSTPPDIVTLGLIPTPILSPTAQYTFAYSGWDDINSVMLAPRTITAEYTETIRSYTVTWYSRAGLSLGSTTVNYGEEAVYSGNIPTNTSQESSYIYNVFGGWNKSTGYITGDTDVYAIWENAALPSTSKDLKDMSPAEVYGVTSSGQVDDYFAQKDYIDITLGHDFNFTNVNSEVIAQETYLDGTTPIRTNITLFGENSPSFTLAVDFRFTDTANTNNTLLACFDESGNKGFRLRMNNNPDIQWGDKNVNVGYQGYRDIVVLRHRAGENKLYVYSSNGTSSSFANAISSSELTRATTPDTEQKLVLGGVYYEGDGGYGDKGSGYIYWAKVWYDDLGDTNARALAAWTHETLRFENCTTNIGTNKGRYALAGNTSQRASMSFISNACLVDRLKVMNSSNTNVGGWDSSAMRTFMNARLPNALPTVWRSLLKKVKISATEGNKSANVLVSEDWFYLPCLREMGGSNDSPYNAEGVIISWFTSDTRRAKFRGKIIPDDATYYTNSSDPSLDSNVTIKSGDVWKQNGNSTCYIYATDEEVRYYGLSKSVAANIGGYWVAAYGYWERSPYVGNTDGFWDVNNNGYANTITAYGSGGVCPCFSI